MRNTLADQARQYDMVARAITYIRGNAQQQPSLKDISANIGLSEFHLQKIFSEWAGISPKRFLQFVTKEYARQALRNSADLLAASLEAGLSSSGRLHDLMVTCEAMSPGEIKTLGAGLEIRFGESPTPFGQALIAWTTRGICHLSFVDGDTLEQAITRLKQDWPSASFVYDRQRAIQLASEIFANNPSTQPLHLLLRGTNFQLKVWEALLAIAPGEVLSYSQVGQLVAMPRACRSIGTAIAKNNIALLIPCHRVIRDNGEISSYRWGADRKTALIAWEAAQLDRESKS